MASRYIYQIHKKYGQWEDAVDNIVGTFYDFDKCLEYRKELEEEYEAEYAKYIKCRDCTYDEPCYRPAPNNDDDWCLNDYDVMWDEGATFPITQIEVKDWEEYNEE